MDEQKENSEAVFNVMPPEGKNLAMGGPATEGPIAPQDMNQMSTGGGGRKWVYIIIGIIVLLAVAGGAYYLLGSKEPETPVTTSRLSKAWLSRYFSVDTCADQATCGENSDPDNDGFGNYDEFKEDTNPLNPDDDGDGLADGDEANIYKTDVKLKFTDKRQVVADNNWTDGYQIARGYDPLTPALAFTEARKKQIADDTVKFKLHEPSITTNASVTTPSPSPSTSVPADWKTYSNTKYGFEIKYPPTWDARDEDNTNGGFYLVLASLDGKLAITLNKDGTNDRSIADAKATTSEKILIGQILSTFKFTK